MAEPEQDCPGAIRMCSSNGIFSVTSSYFGGGAIDETPTSNNVSNPTDNSANTNLGCLKSGELNSVWLRFRVASPGDLEFVLNPTTNNGFYDWALYEVTGNPNACSQIAANSLSPVTCNWLTTTEETGMLNTVPGGFNPANFEPEIPVTLGQEFVIVLSNWSGTADGFTIDFNYGTADIVDTDPPGIASTDAACTGAGNTRVVNITFDEPIDCGTVSTANFSVSGPGSPSITSISPINCTGLGTGFATEIEVTVNGLTADGNYTLTSTGTAITDVCGNSLPTGTSTVFGVFRPIGQITPASSDLCSGESVTLNAPSLPTGAIISWSNGSSANSINVSPGGTTNYTMTATFAGCVQSRSREVVVNPNPTLDVSPGSATVCAGSALFGATTSTAGGTIRWRNSGSALVATGTSANLAPGGSPYTVQHIDANGCESNIQTVVVNLASAPATPVCEVIYAEPTGGCTGGADCGLIKSNPTTFANALKPRAMYQLGHQACAGHVHNHKRGHEHQ